MVWNHQMSREKLCCFICYVSSRTKKQHPKLLDIEPLLIVNCRRCPLNKIILLSMSHYLPLSTIDHLDPDFLSSHGQIAGILLALHLVSSYGLPLRSGGGSQLMISIFKITFSQSYPQKMHHLILTFFGIICRCCPVAMTNIIAISCFRNVNPSKESMVTEHVIKIEPHFITPPWLP